MCYGATLSAECRNSATPGRGLRPTRDFAANPTCPAIASERRRRRSPALAPVIWLNSIRLLGSDHLCRQCPAGLAEPENGTSRYEYRLPVRLLQFHELGKSRTSPRGEEQAACSLEQS